jgi:hypothetical protein
VPDAVVDIRIGILMNSVNSAPSGVGPPARREGWFDKNWKWFVPTLAGALLVCIATFVFGLLSLVGSMFRSSYPYKVALERANASAEVADRIGKPLTVGWLISGSINYRGQAADAAFSIPITGPKGKGTIVVQAKKRANQWTFQTLEVDVVGDDRAIPLIEPGPAEHPDSSDDST